MLQRWCCKQDAGYCIFPYQEVLLHVKRYVPQPQLNLSDSTKFLLLQPQQKHRYTWTESTTWRTTRYPIDTADGQPRAKRQKVDDRIGSPTTIKPSDTTTNLISRPLSEPPIFCYDEHIEYLEAILKAMKERPHDFDADPATRMQALQTEIEEQVFWTYFQWSHDMAEEADRAGNSKALEFYNGLETALLVDERILNVERGSLRLESDDDEWIAGSEIGNSSSEGYATAEEQFGSGTDRSEGS